jgi:SAM-dependent methyltransferase
MSTTTSAPANATYTPGFYHSLCAGSDRSAQELVPLLLDTYHPASVVDVGCGVGTWLAAFRDAGVADVLGIDSEHARRAGLLISEECFHCHDLTTPFLTPRQFDLVLSLEVAEHLPPEVAPTLVQTLTCLGPIVVFSAAVPHQGGTNHVNCQWPSYWARLFARHGFLPSVDLRRHTWSLAGVEPWYRQNLVVYTRRTDAVSDCTSAQDWPLDVIHPETYRRIVDPEHASLRTAVRIVVSVLARRARIKLRVRAS